MNPRRRRGHGTDDRPAPRRGHRWKSWDTPLSTFRKGHPYPVNRYRTTYRRPSERASPTLPAAAHPARLTCRPEIRERPRSRAANPSGRRHAKFLRSSRTRTPGFWVRSRAAADGPPTDAGPVRHRGHRVRRAKIGNPKAESRRPNRRRPAATPADNRRRPCQSDDTDRAVSTTARDGPRQGSKFSGGPAGPSRPGGPPRRSPPGRCLTRPANPPA